VTFEEEAQPRVGDWVVAVGNPFGLGGTATAGIISGLGRNQLDASTPYTDYIQIDAAINRGNSGGPTFDIYGRVIGVNSAILSPTGGSVGIGFAIPASIAKPITDQLRRGESITRGYVGVGIQDLSREERASLGLPANFKGAYVGTVTPGGPADTGGVQLGDIVTHVNGQEIQSSNDLTRRIGQVRPGETVRLQILRDGRRETVTIRAIVRPPESELNASGGIGQAPEAPQAAPSAGTEVVGLTVAPMTPALRRQHEVPERINGLVVTQPGRGSAQGVQPGTVIMRAGNAPVTTVAQLQAAVEAARRNDTGVFLMFWTPAGVRTGVLELPKSE
jgi:serine protease Do